MKLSLDLELNVHDKGNTKNKKKKHYIWAFLKKYNKK